MASGEPLEREVARPGRGTAVSAGVLDQPLRVAERGAGPVGLNLGQMQLSAPGKKSAMLSQDELLSFLDFTQSLSSELWSIFTTSSIFRAVLAQVHSSRACVLSRVDFLANLSLCLPLQPPPLFFLAFSNTLAENSLSCYVLPLKSLFQLLPSTCELS